MVVIALGGVLAFAPQAPAAEKTSDAQAEAKGAARRERLKQVAQDLNLTKEQKAKLKPILQEEAQKVKELRKDSSLARAEKLEKVKEIQQDVRAKAKTILTAEQWEKWEKIRKEAQGRRRLK